ncbi:uncharacterized protein LOC119733087 [Patiria miniata]|uniref:Uncharacterized protein n=1 Tax=Patiria miniata TaxID=46514 RepID=A0A914AGS8_PATMI|nr:uncharacterized protein LOC119733087 [Patiria miniata]
MDEAFRDTATSVFKLRADIRDLEQDALSAKLTYATGPIASALDRVLHDHKVQRQAYHGKAFVGNHVNKCCEPKLIDALTKVPPEELERQLTDDMSLTAQERLRRQAFQHRAHFREVFLKFADVHKGINHALALTDQDVLRIDVSIRELLRTYRQLFPEERITPKLHLLEDHAVDQLQRFRVGLGLLNEQGGELIHAEFNRIGRVVQGMRDD